MDVEGPKVTVAIPITEEVLRTIIVVDGDGDDQGRVEGSWLADGHCELLINLHKHILNDSEGEEERGVVREESEGTSGHHEVLTCREQERDVLK